MNGFITLNGITVTAQWAEEQTDTIEKAEKYLLYAERCIQSNYFPHGHQLEINFIMAKYPSLKASKIT